MSILKNAIESIQVGIEDFESEDDRRNVSAVRNIAAGILLLYKEQLCRLSPPHDKELLIKKNITPFHSDDGTIIFKGKGNKTVDVYSIKERFSSLGVNVDWVRFEKINNLRNNLEHYYSQESPDAVREIISKSFLLIRDFISNVLDENPQELIGENGWDTLLNIAEVYAAEERSCQESLNKIDWKYSSIIDALEYLNCPECHSSLIQAQSDDEVYPSIGLTCKSCGTNFQFDDVIGQCVDDSLSGEAYIAIKDGGEPPYDTCPECDKPTFVLEEGCCLSCGYEMQYISCDACGESLTLDEQWLEGKCGYCQHQWEKVMAE